MSERFDRALDALDALDLAAAPADTSEGYPPWAAESLDTCWRCTARKATTDVGLCEGCLAVMRDDTTTAPEPSDGNHGSLGRMITYVEPYRVEHWSATADLTDEPSLRNGESMTIDWDRHGEFHARLFTADEARAALGFPEADDAVGYARGEVHGPPAMVIHYTQGAWTSPPTPIPSFGATVAEYVARLTRERAARREVRLAELLSGLVADIRAGLSGERYSSDADDSDTLPRE